MNIRIQNAHCMTTFCESCSQVYSYGAFAYSTFAADNCNFMLDLAHFQPELLDLLLLLQKPLPACFQQFCLVNCAHENRP
jgi:hypothetical protein